MKFLSSGSLIMQSGKIPNGSYIFDTILSSDEDGEEIIHQVSKQVDVYEPQYINVISPAFLSSFMKAGRLTDL